MPQNEVYWGVSKQSHLCLSSGSVPQPRRNKPSSLLYDCVCVVSRPEDLAVPPVRSHFLPKRKCTQKHTSREMLRVLLTFIQRNSLALWQIHPRALRTNGCPERWRRVHTLNSAALFHLWSLVINQFCLLVGWVKKAPFTVDRVELELWFMSFFNEMQIQETKTQAHPRVT